MNRAAFYSEIRAHVFDGSLTQRQVAGIEALLAATEGLSITHRAYLLATAYHETAATMQPITEYGGRKYFDKYDTGKLAKALGNTPGADGDGFLYRGRGYVQITGRANYAKAGGWLKLDLIANPDLALQPTVAAQIIVRGCSAGWFTGKNLSDYLPGDYEGARRVVNGVDDAKLIAGYAVEFERALAVAHTNETPRPDVAKPSQSPWAALFAAIAAIVALFGKGK